MRHTLKSGVVILLALSASAALAAEEKDSAMCTFVKRVLAERPSEFAAFKGALSPDGQSGMSFAGTVKPDDTTKCTLHVRRKIGKQVLSPLYGCTKFDLKMEAAKALYVQHTKDLKACLPGAVIGETGPKASDETTTWRWIAKTADHEVKLEASNGIAILTAMFNGKPITDEIRATMTLDVAIKDLSPTPPGATMPEVP